jgi:hypothetical protein
MILDVLGGGGELSTILSSFNLLSTSAETADSTVCFGSDCLQAYRALAKRNKKAYLFIDIVVYN